MTALPSGFTPAPGEADALAVAVTWVQDLLLGSVATMIAVIAIAAIGLLMLTGRLPVRRGLTVLFGCFVLFGAASIAAGLRGAAAAVPGAGGTPPAPQPLAASGIEPALVAPPVAPASEDPYAGASVRR